VFLYGGGFYSFFKDYQDRCAKRGGICQDRLIDTSYSEQVWIYNLYTVGAQEIISPQGTVYDSVDREKFVNGFATAITAWLHLAGDSKSLIGGTRKSTLTSLKSPGGPSMWCNKNGGVSNGTYPLCGSKKPMGGPIEYQPLSDKSKNDSVIDRFEESGARDIWCGVMKNLRTDITPRTNTTFGTGLSTPSSAVAELFGYANPSSFICGKAMGVSCSTSVSCPAGDMKYEGQQLILQSFVLLSKVYSSTFFPFIYCSDIERRSGRTYYSRQLRGHSLIHCRTQMICVRHLPQCKRIMI
jgi:hypothetical protein